MRILVYGAGVIGSLYAAKIANSKHHEVSIIARDKRLIELKENRLLIKHMKGRDIEKANVNIIPELDPEDIYDYILVTVRKDQVKNVLPVLRDNKSKNILFMVNNSLGPSEWIEQLGRERIILGFPGAGGKRENGIVHYHIVSSFIQPTTIGEIDGNYTERLKTLRNILLHAGFHVSISSVSFLSSNISRLVS